jgi:AraC-like DNA-binding protein
MRKPMKTLDGLPFRELLEVMPDVQAWMKDRRGRYLWVNRAFLMNYGLAYAAQVVGKSDRDLSPAHLAAYFQEGDQAVLAGRPVNHRLELVGRYDHSAHWCRTTKLATYGPSGRPNGTVGFTRKLAAAEIEQMAEIPLGAVVATMIRKIGRKITSAEMAKAAGTSVRGLERAFLRDYGLSPQQYLRRLRMQTACQLLVSSSLALAQVADRCGFADQSHFTRDFRSLTGVTPRAYRLAFAS